MEQWKDERDVSMFLKELERKKVLFFYTQKENS